MAENVFITGIFSSLGRGFAEEYLLPATHVAALAPGLVHTAMQDYIYEKVDEQRFPSVKQLKQAHGTPDMPGPREAAQRIADAIETLPQRIDSGGFADIRSFSDMPLSAGAAAGRNLRYRVATPSCQRAARDVLPAATDAATDCR